MSGEQHGHIVDAIHYRRRSVKQLSGTERRTATGSSGLLYGRETTGRVRPWPGEPETAHLLLYHHAAAPGGADLQRWIAALRDFGYQRVRTGAVPTAWAPLLRDSGFTEAQRLTLLRHPLVTAQPRAARPAVRRAGASRRSFARLAPIDAACFDPPWQLDAAALAEVLAATPHHRVRIIGRPRRPVAFAISGRDRTSGYLQRLAVHPDHQRKGHASALVADFINWTSRHGLSQGMVNTHVDNSAALRLYHCAGFLDTGELAVYQRELV
jgi:GNAT superfamily N-acetyltransferase